MVILYSGRKKKKLSRRRPRYMCIYIFWRAIRNVGGQFLSRLREAFNTRIALDLNLSPVKRCFAARFEASFEIERRTFSQTGERVNRDEQIVSLLPLVLWGRKTNFWDSSKTSEVIYYFAITFVSVRKKNQIGVEKEWKYWNVVVYIHEDGNLTKF